MDGDLRLFGGGPLEEEAERDVVGVGGKLPEQGRPVFVSGNANSHCFTVTDLKKDYISLKLNFESLKRCSFASCVPLCRVENPVVV